MGRVINNFFFLLKMWIYNTNTNKKQDVRLAIYKKKVQSLIKARYGISFMLYSQRLMEK